jgi:hypothetical protein
MDSNQYHMGKLQSDLEDKLWEQMEMERKLHSEDIADEQEEISQPFPKIKGFARNTKSEAHCALSLNDDAPIECHHEVPMLDIPCEQEIEVTPGILPFSSQPNIELPIDGTYPILQVLRSVVAVTRSLSGVGVERIPLWRQT